MTAIKAWMTKGLHASPGILETLAVAMLVVAAFLSGVGVLQLFLWAAFGWAFLLRTPRSTGLAIWLALPALRLFRRYFSGPKEGKRSGFFDVLPDFSDDWVFASVKLLLLLPLLLLASAFVLPLLLIAYVAAIVLLLAYIGACRVVATAWCTLRHPIEAARAMPRAWRRTLRQASLASTWELVPGLARFYRFSRGTAWKSAIGVDHPRQLARTRFDRADWKQLAIAGIAAATLVGGALLAQYVSDNAYRLHRPREFQEIYASIPNHRAEAFLEELRAAADPDALLPHFEDSEFGPDPDREILAKVRGPTGERGSLQWLSRVQSAKFLLASVLVWEEKIQLDRAESLAGIDVTSPPTVVVFVSQWVGTFLPRGIPPMWVGVLSVVGAVPVLAPLSLALAALVYAVTGVFRSPLRLVLYLPSLVYRLALKATCLLYFPMIWVFEPKYLHVGEPRSLIEDAALHPYTAMGAFGGAMGVGVWAIKQGIATLSPLARQLLPDSPAASYLYTVHVYDFLMCASALFAIWFWLRARLLERQRSVDLTDARRLVMLGRVKAIFAAYSLLVFVLGAWPHLSSIRIVLPEGGWLPTLASEA